MSRFLRLDSGWGIAVLRMIMGFVLIITGYEKLTSGIQKVSASMVKNRIPFPTTMAVYITALELVGGFLLLIGLGGRWLGLLYTCEFLVVSFYVLVPTRGRMDARLPIMLLAGALMFLVSGSGKASLDRVFARSAEAFRLTRLSARPVVKEWTSNPFSRRTRLPCAV